MRVCVSLINRVYLWQLLVLSYMGSKHGRIIQAHHDGKEMIIQCSELFSFKDKETPPVELFLRYYCSEPI